MQGKNKKFNTTDGRSLDIESAVNEIISFMRSEPSWPYKIIIGTDSKITSDLTADFVTAIVVHRIGNGGRYFWRRVELDKKFHTLRDRIWQEVILSIEAARNILDYLKSFKTPQYDFEIHVDIGTIGATKTLIQEVANTVRANHFEIKTKPESYAASKVADRHV